MLPVLLFYLLLVQWSSEASVNDPEFLSHMSRVRGFPCRFPRLTSVKIIDLINVGIAGKMFVPEVTVLHRCDNGAGCCYNNKVCVPDDEYTQTVELKFYVNDLTNGQQGLEVIEAANHTRCRCAIIEDSPRRVSSKSNQCDRFSLLQTLLVSILLWKFVL